jgi:hypothetical protein
MGRATHREITPDEAKARLRVASARTRWPLPSMKTSDSLLVAFSIGFLTGFCPECTRMVAREASTCLRYILER